MKLTKKDDQINIKTKF